MHKNEKRCIKVEKKIYSAPQSTDDGQNRVFVEKTFISRKSNPTPSKWQSSHETQICREIFHSRDINFKSAV